jgi:hypothetical protein
LRDNRRMTNSDRLLRNLTLLALLLIGGAVLFWVVDAAVANIDWPDPTPAPVVVIVNTPTATVPDTPTPFAASAEASAAPVASAAPPPLQTQRAAYGLELTAHAVQSPAPLHEWDEVAPGRQLLGVELTLANNSGQSTESVDETDFQMVDAGGYVYPGRLTLFTDLAMFPALDLAAGQRARGWVLFEVPTGTVPAAVRFKVNWWTDEYLIAPVPR